MQYREKIDSHKLAKREAEVATKKQELLKSHNALVYTWQKSLSDAGSAQREAKENSIDTVNRLRNMQRTEREKKAKSVLREREALQEIKVINVRKEEVQSEKAQRNSIRRELIASDREDAKAKAEVRKATLEAKRRAAEAKAAETDEPEVVDQPLADKGTVSQQQKSAIVVQARVVRETTRSDKFVVSNKAAVEENLVVKRMFKRCIDELRNKNKAMLRARAARKSTTVVQNVEFLEAEFATILGLDRSPNRQYRVKNASSIPAANEGPVIAQTFEKVFLSDNAARESMEKLLEDDEDEAESEEEEEDLDESMPRPPPRPTRESVAERESTEAMKAAIAAAKASELAEKKKREKSVPLRERVVVKAVGKKGGKSQQKALGQEPSADDEQEGPNFTTANATVTVTVPAPTSASGEGIGAPPSYSWVPTPVWQRVSSTNKGYGLEESIASGEFPRGGEYFVDDVDDDDEEIASIDVDYFRRATHVIPDVAQASMRSSIASSGQIDLGDSVELLGVTDAAVIPSPYSAREDTLEDILSGGAYSGEDDDVELTRGSSSFSPMRSVRHVSPARMSLKDHSEVLSVPQLRVSISSASEDEYEVSPLHFFPLFTSSLHSLFSSLTIPTHHSRLYQIGNNGKVDASWHDFKAQHYLHHRGAVAGDLLNISRASTSVARHDHPDASGPNSLDDEAADAYLGYDETTLSASLENSFNARQDEAAIPQSLDASLASDSRSNSSSSFSSSSSSSPSRSDLYSSRQNNITATSSSFHSSIPPSVPPSAGSTSVSTARVPLSPSSLTVRLQSGADEFAPAQSVSFESLFHEDSADEEEEDEDEDEEDEVEEEEEEEEEEGEDEEEDEEEEGEDEEEDEEEKERANLARRTGSPRGRFGDDVNGEQGFGRDDYTFMTANDAHDSLNTSSSSSSADLMEMYTPRPFPPPSHQSHDGHGSFSRRPFRLVPSPNSSSATHDLSAEEEASPRLRDLLGLAGRSELSNSSFPEQFRSSYGNSSGGNTSSSELNVSTLLGLNREGVWGPPSEEDEDEEQDDDDNDDDEGDCHDVDDDDNEEEEEGHDVDLVNYTNYFNSSESVNYDRGVDLRIENEIAEMRNRLLEAVQNTLSASKSHSASRGSSASVQGSSPFFSFHLNKTGADQSDALSSEAQDSDFLISNASSSSAGELAEHSMSQHSLRSDTHFSSGNLSSSILTGGNLSSSAILSGGRLNTSSSAAQGEGDKSSITYHSLDEL